MTQTIQKLTVDGVTALIEKIATDCIANKVTAHPQMLAAYDAVLSLIEGKAKSGQIVGMAAKVREAVGLPPAKQETEQIKQTKPGA